MRDGFAGKVPVLDTGLSDLDRREEEEMKSHFLLATAVAAAAFALSGSKEAHAQPFTPGTFVLKHHCDDFLDAKAFTTTYPITIKPDGSFSARWQERDGPGQFNLTGKIDKTGKVSGNMTLTTASKRREHAVGHVVGVDDGYPVTGNSTPGQVIMYGGILAKDGSRRRRNCTLSVS